MVQLAGPLRRCHLSCNENTTSTHMHTSPGCPAPLAGHLGGAAGHRARCGRHGHQNPRGGRHVMHACPSTLPLLQHRPRARRSRPSPSAACCIAKQPAQPSPSSDLYNCFHCLPAPFSCMPTAHCTTVNPSPTTLTTACASLPLLLRLAPAPASCTGSLSAVFGVKLHGAGAAAA